MGIPATMRALQQTSRNGPQDMRLVTDAPVPSPGTGEVLLRVAAAGVNFADLSKARGTFRDGPRPPYLAGFEAAGEIVAVGGAVTGAQPRTHVVGVGSGAFAEYVVLPAAAAMPVPPGWTDRQALGLVVNWPTALAALRHLGGVTEGQTVLVHAAAGATGQAAVTVAKHVGATVIATASPDKHETVTASGADHVLDSRRADIAAEVLRLTGGAGVDVVLESAGGATFEASLAAAKRVTGRVVVTGLAGPSPDHQLGPGVPAPGPGHRLQPGRVDRGCAAGLRRRHGRAVHARRRGCARPRPSDRVRLGRWPESARGAGEQVHRRQAGPGALSRAG